MSRSAWPCALGCICLLLPPGCLQHRAAISWMCPKDEISSLFTSMQRDSCDLGADTGYVCQGEEELLCFSVVWPKVHERLCKWKGEQGYGSLISPGNLHTDLLGGTRPADSCSSKEGSRLLCLFTSPLPFSPLLQLPKYPGDPLQTRQKNDSSASWNTEGAASCYGVMCENEAVGCSCGSDLDSSTAASSPACPTHLPDRQH